MTDNDNIKPLPESVVHKIAAGEIIHRSSNVVKELIENSIDAGSKQIIVTLQDAGFKLLSVQDNGCGIRMSDLKILCHRFTTSKLRQFDDLKTISTFGFRGEALSSISHVAHLTVVTKRAGDQVAFKAEYISGNLKTDPKPCAGNTGTLIKVEDLFYNMPLRRGALKSTKEEYNKCMDILVKYALHNCKVGFVLKRIDEKQSQATVNIRTAPNSSGGADDEDSWRKNILASLFDVALSRDIIAFQCGDSQACFSGHGLISHPNYQGRKFILILFINNRLVECVPLKKGLEMITSQLLPKGNLPFIYLSLMVRPENLDVNVHPTKSEVHFLHEETIVKSVEETVQKILLSSDQSRTFFVKQHILPPVTPVANFSNQKNRSAEMLNSIGKETPCDVKIYDHNLVRTDPKRRRLEEFFVSTPLRNSTELNLHLSDVESPIIDKSVQKDVELIIPMVLDEKTDNPIAQQDNKSGNYQPGNIFLDFKSKKVINSLNSTDPKREKCLGNLKEKISNKTGPLSNKTGPSQVVSIAIKPTIKKTNRRNLKLSSIENLKEQLRHSSSILVQSIFSDHTPVGPIDASLNLIQHKTGLYLANTTKLCERFFYQLMLENFGDFDVYRFQEPLNLRTLIETELKQSIDEDKKSRSEKIFQILSKKSAMLWDYFSVEINKTETGLTLDAIPDLLADFLPQMEGLGGFLVSLAENVDWRKEQECFKSICKETAKFYALKRKFCDGEFSSRIESTRMHWRWLVESLLYPHFKTNLIAEEEMLNSGLLYKITDLKDLYKVFERC